MSNIKKKLIKSNVSQAAKEELAAQIAAQGSAFTEVVSKKQHRLKSAPVKVIEGDLPISGVPEQHQAAVIAQRELERETKKMEKAARAERQRKAEEVRKAQDDLEAPAGDTNHSDFEYEDDQFPPAVGDDKDPGGDVEEPEDEQQEEQRRLQEAEDAKARAEFWQYKGPGTAVEELGEMQGHLLYTMTSCPLLDIKRKQCWAYRQLAKQHMDQFKIQAMSIA